MTSDIKNAIRDWWADNPMTYGQEHGEARYHQQQVELGSLEFFEQADQVFYQWNTHLHTQQGYFAKIFDYPRFVNRPVLEVGCGMGCMAMNWAKHGANLTAVDLNPLATAQTKKRFEVFGLSGNVHQADGERLPFEDNTFDYVYSWGVLHHSPSVAKSVAELHRVVKPGGQVGVMLYHRRSVLYGYDIAYTEGFLHLENQFLGPIELGSRYGDGARLEGNPYTRPVTKREIKEEIFTQYHDLKIRVFWSDVRDVLDHMIPGSGRLFPRFLLDALGRRWGWTLWITGSK